jgi:hypothetical protein
MLTLLMLLAQDPATQPAVTAAAPVAQWSSSAGHLSAFQGAMMAWSRGGQLEGDVSFVVSNTGPPDRLVSVSTPAGPVGDISIHVARGEDAVALQPGDLTIAGMGADGIPARSRVVAKLTDLASGQPMPVRTTITVRFEKAGEITISADPASPAPPPPRPPRS